MNNDIPELIKVHNKEEKRKGSISRLNLFKKLKERIYHDSEYRMSLWLPLTLKEKVDMLMHQRDDDEMEIITYLLD